MSFRRFWVWGLIAELFGIVLGGCAESREARLRPAPSPGEQAARPAPSALVLANSVGSVSEGAPALHGATDANDLTSNAAGRSGSDSNASAGSSPAAPSPAAATPRTGAAANSTPSTTPGNPTPSTTATTGSLANGAATASPELVDADGNPLPQTEQRPSSDSAAFKHRVELVAQAILSGDPDPALPAFFPLVAYRQVKDVAKPERDYKFRLLANFKRDLLEYHQQLGKDGVRCKFQGIQLDEQNAKWMAPGSEGNKLGYYRVLRSRLRFTLPTGRTREFELTSLISWRGEWYVVHLHGFK